MMSTTSLLIAVLSLAPVMFLIAWHDLKEMRIPNWTVLAVLGVFVATGSWGLPLEDFLWRLGAAVVVFFLGLGLYSLAFAKVGAGDLKLIAALAPFVAGPDLSRIFLTFALVAIVGLTLQFVIRLYLRGRETGWKALDQSSHFPAGILLGAAIMIHLGISLSDRLA